MNCLNAWMSLLCSKTLSQRVSVYSKKLVGEQDALAVEVCYVLPAVCWPYDSTAASPYQSRQINKPFLLQIKSLQANLQRLRKAAAGVKVKSQQAPIHALLSETEAIVNGVGPGGDL